MAKHAFKVASGGRSYPANTGATVSMDLRCICFQWGNFKDQGVLGSHGRTLQIGNIDSWWLAVPDV